MNHAIFVYGTLKSGHSRNSLLQSQRYLGTAVTLTQYKIYRYGSFPALIKTSPGVGVFGELYEVDDSCLITLDEVEGVRQGLFFRSNVELDQLNLCSLPLHKNSSDLLLTNRTALAYFFVDEEKLLSIKKDCGCNWTLS